MKLACIVSSALILGLMSCSKSSSPGTTPVPPVTTSDSAVLTVVNGYGSGTYKIGDTVNIWSSALPANTVFDQWTGYASLLQNAGEWHNTLVMPSTNVTVTGVQKTITPFTLVNEKIRGVNILKNVYYYFPAGHKGTVFLLHGTSGSAANLVNDPEWMVMINDLVANNYAIIVTEAEEISLRTDINGDGVLRWKAAPLDSVGSVDYGNIKAIRDTFYARGYTQRSIPLYSVGMSDGGAFSSSLSSLYKFKSGVSYCAQGFAPIFTTSTTPFMFSMAKYDNNSEVGAAGNATALTNNGTLTGRGVCSKYYAHDHSPAYPERFARISGISIATSTALFNELKTNHWLDTKNYLTAVSDTIDAAAAANTGAYPVYNGLNVLQQYYVSNQMDAMYAAHKFFSDLNKTTIHFLDYQCGN